MSTSPFDLAGTVSVVTGASSGIGAEIARALGQAGSNVALVGRDANRLGVAARAVVNEGVEAHCIEADICAAGGPQLVVEEVLRRFNKLDVLVHSAGVFLPALFADTTDEILDAQMDTNLRAPFRLTRAAAPHLRSGSSVIFVSSMSGHVGSPECTAYCASKGAVELLVKALATEMAPRGVRVNAVAPGNVLTPMNQHLFQDPAFEREQLAETPAGRIGTVADIAPAVVYLASPAASYVHGASLLIDGGCAAR